MLLPIYTAQTLIVNWLSNFVIDICLLSYACMLDLKNTLILSCNRVTHLIEKKNWRRVRENYFRSRQYSYSAMVG